MNYQKETKKFDSLTVTIHWLSLLLLIAVFGCIELRELFPKGSEPREALKFWHFSLGLSVSLLSICRILWAAIRSEPAITPVLSRWQALMAQAVRWFFYCALITMPVLGWLTLSLEGKAIPLFFTELPALVGPNDDWAERVEEIHETLGEVFLVMIGVHSTAALCHHFIRRDNTLVRMLPGNRAERG